MRTCNLAASHCGGNKSSDGVRALLLPGVCACAGERDVGDTSRLARRGSSQSAADSPKSKTGIVKGRWGSTGKGVSVSSLRFWSNSFLNRAAAICGEPTNYRVLSGGGEQTLTLRCSLNYASLSIFDMAELDREVAEIGKEVIPQESLNRFLRRE